MACQEQHAGRLCGSCLANYSWGDSSHSQCVPCSRDRASFSSVGRLGCRVLSLSLETVVYGTRLKPGVKPGDRS